MPTHYPQKMRGYALLIFTAVIWGSAFVFQKNATAHVDAFTFNFLRFGIGSLAILALFLLPKHLFMPERVPAAYQKRLKNPWLVGLVAGVFLFLAISLQQWGLAYTTAGKSGFFTSLYIIVVPLIGLFFRIRPEKEVWVGALLTLFGVYFLSDLRQAGLYLNKGDALTLISTLFWALQIFWLGVFAKYTNVLLVSFMQMAVTSLLSFLLMQTLPSWQTIEVIAFDLFYTGVLSAAIAFTLQIIGQRYVPSSNATLIMSTEAVFALLFGVLILHEHISGGELFGATAILCGVLLAQIPGALDKLGQLWRPNTR